MTQKNLILDRNGMFLSVHPTPITTPCEFTLHENGEFIIRFLESKPDCPRETRVTSVTLSKEALRALLAEIQLLRMHPDKPLEVLGILDSPQ
ncbi:hypothetical protein ACIQVE_21315 [Pseudomonas sp. NPDC098747]|uniref:hypothetical protein n=1 Tax=Pseudomonas sp. NPDC098747 TaxID=3364487 RepID=UPI00383AD220